MGTLAGSAAVALTAGSLVWAAPNLHAQPDAPTPASSTPVPPAACARAPLLEAPAHLAALIAPPGATIDPRSFEMLPAGQLPPGYAGTATSSVNGQPGRVSLT